MENKKSNHSLSEPRVLLVSLLVYAVVLLAFWHSSFYENKTPAYINLNECTSYLREGFYAPQLLDPNFNDGTWVKSDGMISLKDSGLIDRYKQPMLTMTDKPAQEFTHIIKFDVSSDQTIYMRRNTSVPTLYLPAIGDNWEIYLNGHLLKTEMYLDETGQIENHRRQAQVVIPFDGSYLQLKDNLLVFKIIGSPNVGTIGLLASGVTYIDQYKAVQQNIDDLALTAIIAVSIFMFFYNLMIFMRNRSEQHCLHFALLSLWIGIYTATQIPIASGFFLNAHILFKIMNITMITLGVPLTTFIMSVLKEKLRIWQLGLMAVSVALAAMLPIGGLQFINDAKRIGQVLLIATFITISLMLMGRLLSDAKQYAEENGIAMALSLRHILSSTLIGNILPGILIPCIGTTYGWVVYGDIGNHLSLWLFGIVLGMSIALNDDLTKAKVIASRQNEILEDAIRIRTRELAEQVSVTNAANKSKTKFLATMSHEIRTPLNAILGIADIELMNEDLSYSTKESLEKLQTSAFSLLNIINDILDLSKIETGKIEIAPAEYDVLSMINDSAQMNIVRVGKKNITFKLRVAPELPSMLIGDELRIKQIFNNILSNAIKYTDKGSILFEISREPIPSDESKILFVFSVSDTGQGMKPDDVQNLFAEYSRFNKFANRETEGTGLGMSITKSLIDAMDGTISVESEYGVGSKFTICLPQTMIEGHDEVVGEERADAIEKFKYHETKQTEKKAIAYIKMPYAKILIVDDVDTNLYVARGLLTPYGLQIETVSSGIEAVARVRAGESYDIIFMDQMMPDMDGIEATKLIREFNYYGTIIALTANAIAGNAEKFIASGFDDFLTKPIDIDRLDFLVKKYISPTPPKGFIMHENSVAATSDDYSPRQELMTAFRRDAKKALKILEESYEIKDFKQFTIQAHAMKSALANIGEEQLSKRARSLEEAGEQSNIKYIERNLEAFLTQLADIAKDDAEQDEEEVSEDNMALLNEQLEIIKEAANDYDSDAAEKALRELNLEKWTLKTNELISELSEMVLHSDFDEIVELIEKLK